MDTNFEEGGVFASQEAIFLKRAFLLAQEDLGPEVDLDEAAKSKLAKIVASVAGKRMQAGGGMMSDEDAVDVAAVACSRFIGLRAD
ncbi:hypothetical protein [Beijerinckia sp. L45]|uniref:hypothetical protein n=1 Tax=Beijerinckia sp. L45 TaxID=1641855 RepID=UPI00131CF019|nr:hypothetical protein [Beijerinckia sp. L45]